MGLVVLFASTVMFCLGRTIALLVAARLLQGASAAVVWTVALALLADTVKKDEVGKALGYVSVAMTLGVLFGPMIGGVVYERSGYYPVFAVTFGVIGLDILLRLMLVEKKIAAKWMEPASTPIQNQSTPSIDGGIASAQCDASSAVAEKNTTIAATRTAETRRRKVPSMLILLKSRRLLAAFWGSLATSITMTALDTTIPLYVNQIFGWGSLGAGLVFLALLAPNFAGPLIGHWTDKYGPRWISAGGLLFSIPFWVLLRLVDHDGIRQQVLLCALLLLLGIACAFIMTPLLAEFSKVCDAKERQQPDLFAGKSAYAQSFGIFNVAWAAGSLIGPLVAAGIIEAAGWKTMTWSMALFSAAGVLPALLYSGGMITRKQRPIPGETSSTEIQVT
jgi:MFS family permease